MIKTFALNLPQFHRIPENDEWWGEGFTEWTNVQKSKPLFDGHYQPDGPLDDNYYDLSTPEAIVHQHDLAREYGLDGFIYYHYWFNGKKLLEKPVEMLLDLPAATQAFCLCWANEPWTRVWDGKSGEVIMPQTFGGKDEWLAHIEYLMQFFRDNRYVKIGNRPVFYVYSPSRIPRFDEMVDVWNGVLASSGFGSLYLVEFISGFNPSPFSTHSSAVMEFEPLYSARYQIDPLMYCRRALAKKLGRPDYVDYDYLWRSLLRKNREYEGREIVKCGFTRFDNTPRKGRRALVTVGATPEKFGEYFAQMVEMPRVRQSDMVVVNAWNEWGEGAVLEPDEQFGYGWLKAFKCAVERAQGAVKGI